DGDNVTTAQETKKPAKPEGSSESSGSKGSAGSGSSGSSNGSTHYKNCTAAREAGAAPVRVGDPGHGSHPVPDAGGTGCEWPTHRRAAGRPSGARGVRVVSCW